LPENIRSTKNLIGPIQYFPGETDPVPVKYWRSSQVGKVNR